MNRRLSKDLLYEQVARIGKTLSSPKRLELLELLAQGEKSVDVLATELSADIKLISAHLKALKEARLVVSRRDGKRPVTVAMMGFLARWARRLSWRETAQAFQPSC